MCMFTIVIMSSNLLEVYIWLSGYLITTTLIGICVSCTPNCKLAFFYMST